MNGSYSLPIEETLKTSWSKVSGSKATIWIAFVIYLLIAIGLGIVDQILLKTAKNIEPFYNLIMSIITGLLDMGLVYIGIRRAMDMPIAHNLLFHAFRMNLALKIIGTYILQVLICLIPIMMIVLSVVFFEAIHAPIVAYTLGTIGVLLTIYLSIRLLLSMGFVLDKEVGPVDAIKLSFKGTRSNFWQIFIIFFLQSLFLIICIIPVGIGLIWGIPFAMINYGNVYKNLSTNNIQN